MSSALLLLGVVLLALVAGTTYSAYKRDLDLLKVERIESNAVELNALAYQVTQFSYRLSAATRDPQRDQFEDLLTENAQIRSDAQALIAKATEDANPARSDDFEVLGSLVATTAFIETSLQRNGAEAFEANAAMEELSKHGEQLFARATSTFRADQEANAAIRQTIKTNARSSILLSFLTVALSIVGMAYFVRLNAQNARMADRNMQLASRAEAGSRAKSRLLTMLSHELRTPMNGVLGLVTLGLQQPGTKSQHKLLEQVRGSAVNLVDFLDDMLDFSSLDRDDSARKEAPIFVDELISGLRAKLASMSRRHDVMLDLRSSELPTMLIGDDKRIKQCLYYTAAFIMKNTYEKEIEFETTLFGDEWLWKVDLTMDAEAGENWRLDALVSADGDEERFIVSDTIESAMALGLIESIGGSFKLIPSQSRPNHLRLLVKFPVVSLNSQYMMRVGTRIETHEMQARLARYLAGVPHKMIDTADLAQADIVFVESAIENEVDVVKTLRQLNADAAIVACGKTRIEEIYDNVIFETRDESASFGRVGAPRSVE